MSLRRVRSRSKGAWTAGIRSAIGKEAGATVRVRLDERIG